MTRSHNHEKIEKKSWNTRSTEQNVFSVFSLSVAKLRDWNVEGTKSSAFFRQKSKQNISTCFSESKSTAVRVSRSLRKINCF